MSDIFISYARSTADQAARIAEALRALGYGVWRDDELPAHRAYTDVIEERLKAARAVVVVWSAEAVKSEWVQSEADRARLDHKLVQLSLDGAPLPMPFDRIQCADLAGWTGDVEASGWRKVAASVAELVGRAEPALTPAPAMDVTLALPSKPSIAVLPFANLSGDPEQDYFADGMVAEITSALSRFRSIFVIASSSALTFKGKAVGAQEAARQLGVRYVLEGSVRKAGNRVRIAAQLIEASDGAQLWADRFDDTLEDVFALQDRVALSVAGVMAPAMQEADLRRATTRPTESLGSYDLYLRALACSRASEREATLEALTLLDRAIALDPHFGSALAAAAASHGMVCLNGWSDDLDGHRSAAIRLAQKATSVAGDDPDVLALVCMAMIEIGGDPSVYGPLADRAVALNPGAPLALWSSGWARLYSGEPDLAFEQMQTVLRIDPISVSHPNALGLQGVARFSQQRWGETVPLLLQSIQLLPEWPLTHAFLAASYGHLGRNAAALEAIAEYRALVSMPIQQWVAILPNDVQALILEGFALAEAGAPRTESTPEPPS